MKKISLILATLTCVSSVRADWPQFRGPDGHGVARDGKAPPAALTAQSIQWKVALPGRGLSSPIVIGDQIFLTASSGPTQERLHVFCFSAADGSIKWEHQFAATGRTMCHEKTCVAAPTPCSDGKRIFVQYSSNDVAAFTLNGDLLWMRGLTHDYPNASNSLGMASSLTVVNNVVVAMIENDSDSFTVGLDAATGNNLWKMPRKKIANWTSPCILKLGDSPVVMLLSQDGAEAVNPVTGSALWKTPGGTTTPSCAVAGDRLIVPANGLTVFKTIPNGPPEELWRSAQLANGTSSPVVWRENVLCINNAGVLACGNLADGSVRWKTRLEGPFSGSPIVAGDTLFAVNEKGILQFVQLKEAEEPAAPGKLPLGETILCTPAISNGAIYLRSDQTLWKIGDKG